MWEIIKSFIWGDFVEELDDSQLLEELDLIETEKPEEAIKHGIVTDFQDDFGIIDGELYFPRTLVPKISFRPLRLNDNVQFKVTRKSENQQWKVVEIVNNYGQDDDDGWTDKQNIASFYNKEDLEGRVLSRDVAKVIEIKSEMVKVEVEGTHMTETLAFHKKKLDFDAKPGTNFTPPLLIKKSFNFFIFFQVIFLVLNWPLKQMYLMTSQAPKSYLHQHFGLKFCQTQL